MRISSATACVPQSTAKPQPMPTNAREVERSFMALRVEDGVYNLSSRNKNGSGDGFAGAASRRQARNGSVLLTRWRRALGERPYTVGELEHQEAVVLAGRPQRAPRAIEVHLRRAPVGSTGTPLAGRGVIGADRRSRGRDSSRRKLDQGRK